MIDPAELGEIGFATEPLLDRDQLGALRRIYEDLGVDPGLGFFASSNDLERDRAAEADALVRAEILEPLQRVLPHHEAFLTSFLVKGAGSGARIEFHQDLSYTDERSSRSVVVWIPLDDVDAATGALAVVPGSHRWATGSRPGGLDELPTAGFQDDFARRAVSVDVPAGTAVAYDPALVHGSRAISLPRPRIAVGAALARSGEPLVHVHADADGGATAYRVDTEYHLRRGLRNRPVGYDTVPLWSDTVAPGEFAARLS